MTLNITSSEDFKRLPFTLLSQSVNKQEKMKVTTKFIIHDHVRKWP